jgi:hypothetical protein
MAALAANELPIPGEDPRAMKPRSDGVGPQRPPHRCRRDECHHAPQHQFPSQLRAAPARQGHAGGGGRLTGQRFDLGVHRGGKHPGPPASGSVLQALQALLAEPPTPPVHHLRAGLEASSHLRIRPPFTGHQHDLGRHPQAVRSRIRASPTLKFPTLLCGQEISNRLTLPWATPSSSGENATTPTPLAAEPYRITST